MSIVKIKDLTFKTFIPESEIQQRVKAVAEKINKDLDGKNPLLLAVLNGSFVFAADLIRNITIVEDIVDTGFTMKRMIETLGTRHPESIHICSLLVKPDKLQVPLNIEYAAIEIPNDFIVGYGLDYDQQGRQLRDIYTIVDK